jgi:hypothetical protein
MIFTVEMKKYIPAGSSEDPEVEPGISIVQSVMAITRF